VHVYFWAITHQENGSNPFLDSAYLEHVNIWLPYIFRKLCAWTGTSWNQANNSDNCNIPTSWWCNSKPNDKFTGAPWCPLRWCQSPQLQTW